jgi:hypothetical protein
VVPLRGRAVERNHAVQEGVSVTAHKPDFTAERAEFPIPGVSQPAVSRPPMPSLRDR